MRVVPLEVRQLSHAAARGGQSLPLPKEDTATPFCGTGLRVSASGRKIAPASAAKSSNDGPILSYLRQMETNGSHRVRVRHQLCGHVPLTHRQRALMR